MQRDLQNLRKSYEKSALLEAELPDDPFELFHLWFDKAEKCNDIDEANAMNLSTIGTDGFPKTRIVLLKEIVDGNFLFYSNYTSEKARSIENHPRVSLNFFWPALEKQVIIKAEVSKVSREKSKSYYHSRPRGSQIGAWVSDQSSEIDSRDQLMQKLKETEDRFEDQEVPLPDFWGGYSCKPHSFEFWQGRENRLHDRILFTKDQNGSWTTKRLQP
ncbi:MAG: pyridoxamine 5'-phosphate oxidase [Nonlabens sp.]